MIFDYLFLCSASENCCQSKKVGSHTYTFNRTQENFLPNCLDTCIYTRLVLKSDIRYIHSKPILFRDGGDDNLYCFVPGVDTMTCLANSGDILLWCGVFFAGFCVCAIYVQANCQSRNI